MGDSNQLSCRVREALIPVRGRRRKLAFVWLRGFYFSQRSTNPRKGTETMWPLQLRLWIGNRQRSTNPRKGTETSGVGVSPFCCRPGVREALIPVRGRRPIFGWKTNHMVMQVREALIPVRGRRPMDPT